VIEIREEPPADVGRSILEMEVPSKLAEKEPTIERLLGVLRDKNFIDRDAEMKARLCLDEVIVNAMEHGNKLDEAKTVRIELFASTSRWAIRVRDEGEGFEPQDVPDPDDPMSLFMESGRGVLLINSFMDEVHYYDGGRAVQLAKRRVTWLVKLQRIPGKVRRKIKRWRS